MGKKISLLLGVILLSFQFCYSQPPLGFSLTEGRKKVQIPFSLYNNLVVVPVVLNGMLPLKFVVDTGVQTGILTEKSFADILSLPYSRKYTIAGPGGQKIAEAYVTNNVSLDLPGVQGKGHALLVLEQDYLELRNYLGTDVHGVIGYELFSRFIIKVNYEKKIMTIIHPSKFKPRRKYQRIPITVEDTKPYLYAEVMMNDSTKIMAKLLVDSGASHGLLLDPATDARIQVPDNAVSSQIGRGIGGAITGKVGRIQSVQLGEYKLERPIANFPDPNSYMDSLKLGKTFRNGTIGGEVLSRFTVIYDFAHENIYIRKNAAFKKKFYYNLSGLVVKALGADLNIFEITEVRERSAAERAGVQSEDQLISINGMPTRNMTLNEVLSYFNSKPGKRIKIQVNRLGTVVEAVFVLEDQI